MTKSDHQQRVEQFMKLADQELPATPMIPSKEVRLLRAKLILEEALETITALGFEVLNDYRCVSLNRVTFDLITLNGESREPSLEEIADGCADLSVVNTGTLSACGIHDQELLEEVDKSNLAKFEVPKCPEHGVDMMLRNNNDVGDYKCCVPGCLESGVGGYKRSDGKWIKPPDWKKPDISKVLHEQERNESYFPTCSVPGCKQTLVVDDVCYDHSKLCIDCREEPSSPTFKCVCPQCREIAIDKKLKQAIEKIPDSPAYLRQKKNQQYAERYGKATVEMTNPTIATFQVVALFDNSDLSPSTKARRLEAWKESIVQEAVQRITESQQYNLEIDRQIHLSLDRIVQELERLVQNKTSWYNTKEFLWKELLLLVKAIT